MKLCLTFFTLFYFSDGIKGAPLEAQEVDDLIHLGGPLTEDAVLKTLHARFMTQQFYVSVHIIYLYLRSLYSDSLL